MKYILPLLLCLIVTGIRAQQKILLYNDCETKPLIDWGVIGRWDLFQGNTKPEGVGNINSGSSQIVISDSFARKGSTSYRFSIKKDTSYGATGLSGTSRSELVWNISSKNVKTGIRWVAASILIPTWFTDDIAPDGVLFSSLPVPYDHPTPAFMYIQKGHWFIEGIKVSDSGKVTGVFLYDLGQVSKGVWTDWIIHRNFTQKDTGYIDLYKNGKLVLSHKGGNWIETGHYAEMYMPLGINKWPWNDPGGEGRGASQVNDQRVVYYDEIKIGTSSAKLEDFIVVTDSSKNKPPTVEAGKNLTINLPKNWVTLTGKALDSDGIISKIQWELFSGDSSLSIFNASELSTTVNNLKAGTYKFRLTVKDNVGALAYDEMFVTLGPALPGGNPNIFFYDDAEDEPDLQPVSEWNQFPNSRWHFFTANGNDVTNKTEKGNLTVSTAYARKGSHSYKISVTKNPTYDPPSMRAELSWNQPATKFVGYHWMSASMLVPKTWVDDCTPTGVLFNTKASPDNYVTPFRLQILKNHIYAVVVNILPDGKVKGEISSDLGIVEKGVWIDWTLNRNFTQEDSGYIRLYKNGRLIWERKGPNWLTGTGRAKEAYILQGLYKWPWQDSTGMGWGKGCFNGTVEAYYDEFKFGGYGAKITDFVTADSAVVVKPPVLSSPGTPVYFDKIDGQLTQSPPGVWLSYASTTIAVSSGQKLVGNGWFEMAFPDTLGNSGILILDDDSLSHDIFYKDSTGTPDDLIWIMRVKGKLAVGDFKNGKHVQILTEIPIAENSLIRIKRLGTAFIAQTYIPSTGWISVYTFEYRTSAPVWIKSNYNNNGIYFPVLGK